MVSFGRVHEHALAPVRGAPPISVIICSFPSGAESFEEGGNALSGHTRCTAEAYLIVALCARMKSRLAPWFTVHNNHRKRLKKLMAGYHVNSFFTSIHIIETRMEHFHNYNILYMYSEDRSVLPHLLHQHSANDCERSGHKATANRNTPRCTTRELRWLRIVSSGWVVFATSWCRSSELPRVSCSIRL